MRVSIQNQEEKTVRIICNQCRKQLEVSHGGSLLEDYLHVEKTWGYFSGQDGQRISFDLCEDCTKKLIQQFAIPVYQEDVTELL